MTSNGNELLYNIVMTKRVIVSEKEPLKFLEFLALEKGLMAPSDSTMF